LGRGELAAAFLVALGNIKPLSGLDKVLACGIISPIVYSDCNEVP
jgi:hypothetical protein